MHLTLDLEGQDDILFACFIVRMSMSKSIQGCLKMRYMTQSLENINININIKFINYSCPKTVLYLVNSYQLSVLVVESLYRGI